MYWKGIKTQVEVKNYNNKNLLANNVKNIIPGVEIFKRKSHTQNGRGVFSELFRTNESKLDEIQLTIAQWSASTIYHNSVKGFHIHPPYIPPDDEESPGEWFIDLFQEFSKAYHLRKYNKEQWDVMFFISGTVNVLLKDERIGLQNNTMNFIIDGDNHPGDNNYGIIIPPGVAHAFIPLGVENVVMVYGTSTVYDPNNEGRIYSGVEDINIPEEWKNYFAG